MADKTIETGGHTITTSKLDKLLYPKDGVSKGDVLDYYQDVADAMLRHLRERPLVLRRFPDGIESGGFFQKNASDYFPDWIMTVEVPERTERDMVRHAVCDDAATLLYLANQACLEFHPWLSHADALDCPDRLVVDVDPPDGADIGELRDVLGRIREMLTRLRLVPFVQTTGGKGFHVVAPLDGASTFDEVRALARAVVDRLAGEDPDRLTTEQRKDRRAGRIFLDVARNAYGQTAVAPYSLRGRPHAPVATPVEWSELGDVRPDSYRIDNVRRRLAHKADPWSALHRHRRSAADARGRLDRLDRG